MNTADRKKQLIVQGAVYRSEVLLAKQATQASLHPEAIAKNTWRHAVQSVRSMFDQRGNGGLQGVNLEALLPIVMTAVSTLVKNRAKLKPLMKGGLSAGVLAVAAAGAVAFLAKRKNGNPHHHTD